MKQWIKYVLPGAFLMILEVLNLFVIPDGAFFWFLLAIPPFVVLLIYVAIVKWDEMWDPDFH